MSTAKTGGAFLTGSLMGHVVRMSLTSSVGLMAIFAVDFIDMIFIAMLGNAALAAAVGYAGTVLFFTTSISIGISIAAGALVARSIGADDRVRAREFASSTLVLGVLLAVLTVAVLIPARGAILDLLGARDETRDLAASYLVIILPSMPILMAAMVASAVLRAHGDAKRAMYATLIGGCVNAVLDPILIFGAGLDLEGAAIASVVARVAILFVALRPALRMYDGIARPRMAAVSRDARAVADIAGPAVLANVATPVGSAIITREMARHGTDAVAAMAIIGRLTPVAFGVIFALSGAIGPIVGQNFGAGQIARVRTAFFAGLQFLTLYVLAVSLILYLLRAPIADLFEAAGETRALVFLFCGPLALGFVFNGAIFVGNAAFNNLGHPIYSTWINWGRHTLGTWPPALLGGWAFGAGGVLIGQAVGGLIFAVISVVVAMRMMSEGRRGTGRHAFHGQTHAHLFGQRRH